MRAPLLALAALFLANAAHAQDLRDFCADRPGKGTPPCILDAGHIQLEVGVADAEFQSGGGVHSRAYTFGETELRLGLSPTLEAQVSWAPLIIEKERGFSRITGSDDLTLGLITALTDPDGKGMAASLQGFVTAPTATHGLGAGGWSGGARLPAEIPFGHGVSLGLTPEVDIVRNADGGGTHLALVAAVGVGRAFGRLSLEIEAWGAIDDDPTARTYQASADVSAALALGDNAQLDAGVNLGLNRDTPDVEVYAGIARRF
jgi:hypothetical protein